MISLDGATPRVDTLHTTLYPKSVSVGGLQLEFTQLYPYRVGNESIPPDQYMATFVLKTASLATRQRRSRSVP